MQIAAPNLLNLPPKLLPMVANFSKYKFFVIEGGRGSGKTQSVARILLKIADEVKIRTFCGREVQNTIEESVHAALADIIMREGLAYKVTQKYIEHYYTGSTFKFKGFREQGAVNIKGVEGADIIWIDEAQTVTKKTLDMLIPTIRKNNSKLIFTMNRFMRDDAVINELVGRPDCLHIKINYFENPFCPLTLKIEAEVMKNKSEREYRHIWLGEPLATAGDYLFNFDKLHEAYDIQPFGEVFGRQRVLGIDFAAQGDDQCVATVLDRVSNQHWRVTEQIAWDEPDSMISVGKIVNMIATHKPDITVLDVGGMGHVVHNRLTEVGMKIHRFDGNTTQGVDVVHYVNARAEMYYIMKDWLDLGFLILNRQYPEITKQAEKIKMKFRSDGRRLIQSKVDMKKEENYSPDDLDSVAMAIYGAVKYLGRSNTGMGFTDAGGVSRKSGSKRKR